MRCDEGKTRDEMDVGGVGQDGKGSDGAAQDRKSAGQ